MANQKANNYVYELGFCKRESQTYNHKLKLDKNYYLRKGLVQ